MTWQLWIRETCHVPGGGEHCIIGEGRDDGTHDRQIRDDDIRDALTAVAREATTSGPPPRDLLDVFKEELRP